MSGESPACERAELTSPICFSSSAASSGVARGRIPGSLKLVRSRVSSTNRKRTPPMAGMQPVRCWTRKGQLGHRRRQGH